MKFINLTSTDSSIKKLNLRKSEINAVYIKETSAGRFTSVVSNGIIYHVKESFEEILKKINSWF